MKEGVMVSIWESEDTKSFYVASKSEVWVQNPKGEKAR